MQHLLQQFERKRKIRSQDKSSFQSKYLFRLNFFFRIFCSFHEKFLFSFVWLLLLTLLCAKYYLNQMGIWYKWTLMLVFPVFSWKLFLLRLLAFLLLLTFYKFYSTHYSCVVHFRAGNLVFHSIIQERNSNSSLFLLFIRSPSLIPCVLFNFQSLVHVNHKIWCDGFHCKWEPTTTVLNFRVIFSLGLLLLSICVFIYTAVHTSMA